MKTNILSFINLIVQKSGPDALVRGKTAVYPPGEMLSGRHTTDNNVHKRREFNETLRAKINPNPKRDETDGGNKIVRENEIDKQEKAVSKRTTDPMVAEIAMTETAVQHKTETFVMPGNDEKTIMEGPESEGQAVTERTLGAKSIDVRVNGREIPGGARQIAVPESTENPTLEQGEGGEAAGIQTAVKMPTGVEKPVESGNTGEKQSLNSNEANPDNAEMGIKENKQSQAISQPGATRNNGVPEPEESTRIAQPERDRTQNPDGLPLKVTGDNVKSFKNNSIQTPPASAPLATDASGDADDRSQETLDSETLQASPEKTSTPADVINAQAAAHKMNVSSEKMNALASDISPKAAIQQSEKKELSVERSFSEGTPQLSESPEKSAGSREFERVMGPLENKFGISRQIHETVTQAYRPGTQQIIIRLDPPDLGRVNIRFIEQRDGITGILQVDKSQTRQEIQEALPGIIQNLQNADIPVKKLEVVLNNPQNNAAGEQSGGQTGSFEQHDSAQDGSFHNAASYTPWRTEAGENPAQPHSELTDKSINMLI